MRKCLIGKVHLKHIGVLIINTLFVPHFMFEHKLYYVFHTLCSDAENRKRKPLALDYAFIVETVPSYKNTMLQPPLLLPLWRQVLFVFVNLVLNIAELTLYRPPKIRSMVMLSVK